MFGEPGNYWNAIYATIIATTAATSTTITTNNNLHSFINKVFFSNWNLKRMQKRCFIVILMLHPWKKNNNSNCYYIYISQYSVDNILQERLSGCQNLFWKSPFFVCLSALSHLFSCMSIRLEYLRSSSETETRNALLQTSKCMHAQTHTHKLGYMLTGALSHWQYASQH